MTERHIDENMENTDKAGRGTNIPHDWKRYIVEEAKVQSHKPRMLLADEILEKMEQSKDRKDRLPERESIAKLISRARNHSPSDLDRPWCIGTVVDYDIPPEALPIVLKVWKMSLLMEFEQPLAIRQAKWVARLYTRVSNRNIASLYIYATMYARREHACEILRIPFDTADLDYELTMKKWEITTLDVIGKPPIIFPVSKAPVKASPQLEHVTQGTIGESLQFILLDHSDRLKDPTIDLTEEEEWIYAMWLHYLGKGPKWWSLSDRERREIMVQLQEWVKRDMKTRNMDEGYSILTKPEHILDLELLHKVGYRVELP